MLRKLNSGRDHACDECGCLIIAGAECFYNESTFALGYWNSYPVEFYGMANCRVGERLAGRCHYECFDIIMKRSWYCYGCEGFGEERRRGQ